MKYINQTDRIIIGANLLALITLSIDTKIGSVIPLYFSDIIILMAFIYWSIRNDPTTMLRRSLIMGAIVSILYVLMDSLFTEVNIITYLRSEDLYISKTPLSVILFWIYFITTMMYLYQRLRSVFSKFYIPSLLSGAVGFLLGLMLNYLGYHARLWVWSVGVPPLPSIGPVPLFVPIAFFLTFFASPYIIGIQSRSMTVDHNPSWVTFFRASDNPLSGGVRCAIVLCASLYGVLRILTKLRIYL